MERKNYSKKFKENAVKLSYERSSQSALAKELGISPTHLSKWRKEFSEHGSASFQGRGVERLSDEQRRIKDLEKALYYALAKNYIKNFGVVLLTSEQKRYMLGLDDNNAIDNFLMKLYNIVFG